MARLRIWSKRAKIKDRPALLLWGMKDIAFRENEIERWSSLFSDCRILRYEDAGHFVQEEKGEELVPIIDEFMVKNK